MQKGRNKTHQQVHKHSHIYKVICGVLREHKGFSLLMALAVLASVLMALIPPLVLEQVVNQVTAGEENSAGESVLLVIAFFYLLIVTLSGISESLQNIMITVMGQKITHALRSELAAKLRRLPTSYFSKNDTGSVSSRFVNDVDAVDSLFTNGIIGMVADALKIVSILAVIFMKSMGLGIILIIVTPLLYLMTNAFQKKMRAAQIENRRAIARVSHHVPETIRKIRMISTFGCERFMEDKYDTYIEDGYRSMDKSNFYDSIYSPIIIMTSTVIIAVLMVCSSSGASVQAFFGISVGGAVAIITYINEVLKPLESLGMEIQNIQSALAGVDRIDEFLDEEEVAYEKADKGETTDSVSMNQVASIRFSDVTFGYDTDHILFKGLNISIARGEKVVITGRTGAGKSTLFKLLLGLYPPMQGTVTIGDEDVRTIPPEYRRRIFGYVEQHFAIVEGTVRDQVTLYQSAQREKIAVEKAVHRDHHQARCEMKEIEPADTTQKQNSHELFGYTDEQVIKALAVCGLNEKIESLPQGLDTSMNVSDFSQGELQLLGIARALVAEPEIMLLDEMTANLDSHTEQRIMETVERVARGRTVISISHRTVGRVADVRNIQLS